MIVITPTALEVATPIVGAIIALIWRTGRRLGQWAERLDKNTEAITNQTVALNAFSEKTATQVKALDDRVDNHEVRITVLEKK